jgi:hypothetical protein
MSNYIDNFKATLREYLSGKITYEELISYIKYEEGLMDISDMHEIDELSQFMSPPAGMEYKK